MASELTPAFKQWKIFCGAGQFRKAYESIDEIVHPHAYALKGKIHSLELEFDEAWFNLDKAVEEWEKSTEPCTISDLKKQFELETFRLSNALLEGSIGTAKIPEINIPKKAIPDPTLNYVLTQRKLNEAILRLHTDESKKAIPLFVETLCRKPTTILYLGLAAAQYNAEKHEKAYKNLESASSRLQRGVNPLTRLISSAHLHAFYSFLENKSKAKEWRQFLEATPSPKKTIDIYKKHAQLYHERCEEAGRLLIW